MAKLYFRYGTMGSGKTIDLLKVAYNYRERNQDVILLTSAIDDRYGKNRITTRIGLSEECYAFFNNENLFEYVKKLKKKPDAILVDEAQFMTKEQVYNLSDVVDYLNIPVICYGLRADFKNEIFEGSLALMEMADKIEEIKTICECGSKATCNLRMIGNRPVKDGEKIFIGGNEAYIALCRKCYKKYMNKN